MRLAAVQPWASWTLMAWAGRGALTRAPPHRIMGRFWQPRPKSRIASILETVSRIAGFGQQQWSCTNFRCSDGTLRSRDRIFKFSQEMVKICAAARNLDNCVNFGRSGRYNQPVQYGRDIAHKSRAAWAIRSLEVYMSERQHIYKDLRAIQPHQEEVSSWRFCRAQIVSGRKTFTPIFWQVVGILARRIDFDARQSPIVRLKHPPEFSWDAGILSIPQNFHETPKF